MDTHDFQNLRCWNSALGLLTAENEHPCIKLDSVYTQEVSLSNRTAPIVGCKRGSRYFEGYHDVSRSQRFKNLISKIQGFQAHPKVFKYMQYILKICVT